MIIRWSGVAAVLIIAFCSIPLFRLSDSQLQDELVVKEGKLQAMLTTADGNVISIQERMALRDLGVFQIRDSVKELICGRICRQEILYAIIDWRYREGVNTR